MEAGKDDCVGTLKTIALTTANNQQFIGISNDVFLVNEKSFLLLPWFVYVGECRLRDDDDVNGMGPPLYESQTLTDAGISPGQRLILEPGQAPTSNQVPLLEEVQHACTNSYKSVHI